MSHVKTPLGEHVPAADQLIVTYGVPWSHYEAQLALHGGNPVPRMAYLGGALELPSPSKDHERIKSSCSPISTSFCWSRSSTGPRRFRP